MQQIILIIKDKKMQNSLAYNAYSQNQVGIESPQKLIEMLYEGILRFVQELK